MNRYFLLIFLLAVSVVNAQVSEKKLKKHICYLAADNMKGRQTGSREAEAAAKYIERKFKQYGLQPMGTDGFRQHFEAKVKRVVVTDSIRKAANIIGFLNNNAPYTIVVGAHYDHIGYGDLGNSKDSLNIGKIHNGADDNASGVAGLLELAKHYAKNRIKERFNLLFIAFGAEELGLLGSKYFVEHPVVPLNTIHWMLNMDMIGRYNPGNGVAVIGYGTSSRFPEIFKDIPSGIKFYTGRDGNGGSDQTSFYKKNIPVLFFHTGGHPDYHKTGDDPSKIDFKALRAILELEIRVIDRSMGVLKMDFIRTN
ncbi:M20/M25/M40 family metallo-hydrolase [Niabella drilacis]|uniref:Peptidase family M28 n=1 Tax=Niabella drilacis (strain DSM 25811 / CCM 8410 / CCUG 62505 / LMG 26954 / E90) TaxID=1285928 RepID=A0A1G7BP18_NIADE|nr:M20/M25/M40 family metallo-hydrolase [Niabella drilacis]SDE28911.1 Peptidase family M28 [Niabella drilacis]